MVSHCRPSKLSLGGLTPKLSPIGNHRNVKVWNRAVFQSVDGPRWNYNLHYDASARFELNNGVFKNNMIEEEEQEEEVHCQVEVVSWRERRIKAHTFVHADVDSVWKALTDYQSLADFIPNLLSSRRIACPYPGRIWLEQRGFQRALYWHIQARVVLDLQEFIHSDFDRELHFSMVDGDFKKFEGKWFVKCGTRSSTAVLSYEVSVIPRCNFPAIFLERIIRSDLPVNLRAVACRAEKILEGNQNTVTAGKKSWDRTSTTVDGSFLTDIDGSLKEKDNLFHSELKPGVPISNFGRLSPSTTETKSKLGILCKSCGLDRQCMVDEVHLRRFDGLLENGGVHRFVVASITVKAPVRELWNVLTAYERLPEIVPHLAISKILSRENNKVRILQEGCKGLLYMVLHARVVLDLCEVHEQEISFEQVEGDFDSLQGKWVLEQLGNHHTLLKYTVESKMHKDTFLSEAIMEEVIYEDLPSNLCAIRDYVEKGEVKHSSGDDNQRQRICMEDQFSSSDIDIDDDDMDLMDDQVGSEPNNNEITSTRQRLRVPGLQRDIEVLKAELLKFISEHGQEGFMPMRKQLRLHGRVDIEKAITRMGGFRRIASLMNLSLAYKNRKPKGFWDNFENLQEEITRFQRNWGMDPSVMPSRKTFERAGRYDIARALEKWGGLHEVSRLLSLKVRHPNKQASLAVAREKKSATSCLEDNKSDTTTLNCYVSQDHTQNWMSKLKHLDIN